MDACSRSAKIARGKRILARFRAKRGRSLESSPDPKGTWGHHHSMGMENPRAARSPGAAAVARILERAKNLREIKGVGTANEPGALTASESALLILTEGVEGAMRDVDCAMYLAKAGGALGRAKRAPADDDAGSADTLREQVRALRREKEETDEENMALVARLEALVLDLGQAPAALQALQGRLEVSERRRGLAEDEAEALRREVQALEEEKESLWEEKVLLTEKLEAQGRVLGEAMDAAEELGCRLEAAEGEAEAARARGVEIERECDVAMALLMDE
eukprot:CAMPEP_0169454366 /NCGR_PEP_ID=MMETSP1042-20121227/15242_1 /TAXON_ID=464988 /ORGANISM="Hemiselmis andersenii, Strain CCMP1180" /LENGTH=277 /DNA_ID=CAMNT_0009566439 /DNA_START=229 /DNA_END=1059 /DNA_ORIENTATION=+